MQQQQQGFFSFCFFCKAQAKTQEKAGAQTEQCYHLLQLSFYRFYCTPVLCVPQAKKKKKKGLRLGVKAQE